MGGGLSLREIEPRRVRHVILAIDAMEYREYMRHCSGSYKAGGDGHTAFLPCDSFLHQSDILLLLFGGMALRAQGGFEDMVQLDLI